MQEHKTVLRLEMDGEQWLSILQRKRFQFGVGHREET
jgi:hypothetical protein